MKCYSNKVTRWTAFILSGRGRFRCSEKWSLHPLWNFSKKLFTSIFKRKKYKKWNQFYDFFIVDISLSTLSKGQYVGEDEILKKDKYRIFGA